MKTIPTIISNSLNDIRSILLTLNDHAYPISAIDSEFFRDFLHMDVSIIYLIDNHIFLSNSEFVMHEVTEDSSHSLITLTHKILMGRSTFKAPNRVAVFDSNVYSKDEVNKMNEKQIISALKKDCDTACSYTLKEYEEYHNEGCFTETYIRFYYEPLSK